MSKFNRIASVQFSIAGSDQTVTVSDLPYVWDDAKGPIDQQAIFDACNYLRSIGVQRGLSVVWVETRPNMTPVEQVCDCPECNGIGRLDREHEHSDGSFDPFLIICTNCGGTGKITKTEEDNA